jgi:hypothetical protein
VPNVEAHDQEFVVAIAKAIVGSVDPAGVRYVDADAAAYFADPRRALARADADTPLGSGLEDVLPSLGIAALYVAQKAFDSYLEEALKKSKQGLGALLKRHRRRKEKTPALLRDVPPLSEDQIAQVFRAVVEAAGARGLDAEGADSLAAAVRDRLPGKIEPGGGGQ